MSEFDAHDNETAKAEPRPSTGALISTSSLRDGGATYTESLPSPANENITALNMQVTAQLPHEIQAAIGE